MHYLNRYGRAIKKRAKLCRRSQPHRVGQDRPFALSENPDYLMLGWGYFPDTRELGQHYLRLRRFIGASDPSLLRGMSAGQAIGEIILQRMERRSVEAEFLRSLLQRHPTHILRLGWKTPLGTYYDILDIRLSFTVQGYYSDGLARAFGQRLLEAIYRNTGLTSRLCPSTKNNREEFYAAACFWFGAAFMFWLEYDLGIKTR